MEPTQNKKGPLTASELAFIKAKYEAAETIDIEGIASVLRRSVKVISQAIAKLNYTQDCDEVAPLVAEITRLSLAESKSIVLCVPSQHLETICDYICEHGAVCYLTGAKLNIMGSGPAGMMFEEGKCVLISRMAKKFLGPYSVEQLISFCTIVGDRHARN